MYHDLLINPSFHAFLMAIDDNLAEQARKKGCSCGGALHQANYPRSSLGLPIQATTPFRKVLSIRAKMCLRQRESYRVF